jgi:hypothetical protein
VSCTSASTCTAVGPALPAGNALIERWNGRQWSVQPTPIVKNDTLSLYGVSCTSAARCTAVGEKDLPDTCGYECYPVPRTLAERWNGKSWAVQRTPSPRTVGDHYKSPAQLALQAVSCSSAKACIAVGS